jgi:phosphotriesterase-related protein
LANINTVQGPIDSSKLGFTLMHEHILISSAGIPQNYPQLLGNDFIDDIVTELKSAKLGGIDTIVDATTLDLGRDVNILVEASKQSGVNIITCTGWYLYVSKFMEGIPAEQYAQAFINDIEKGIAGTGIKAGILKAASDIGGVTIDEESILRGVAKAHVRTGVPIMLHSYSPGQVAKQQLPILKEEGVDLKRVKVDHCLDTTDVEYLIWILDQGCYLGLERYPGVNTSPMARTKTFKALIDAGYADHLLPSHDWGLVFIDSTLTRFWKQTGQPLNPHGFLYLKKVVFPQLLQMGISESTLNSLCTANPREFFMGK